jgi:hypothetical protein
MLANIDRTKDLIQTRPPHKLINERLINPGQIARRC